MSIHLRRLAPKVTSPALGVTNSRGVTGGVYKTRGVMPRRADPRLLAIPASCRRVAAYNPELENGFGVAYPRFAARCTIHCLARV